MNEITGISTYKKLDDIFVSGNGNENLEHVGGRSSALEFNELDEILERNVLVTEFGTGTNFESNTKTYLINLGELLNKVAPVTKSEMDYQREKRDIGAKEMGELHQVVCETGQTDLVSFTLCLIKPLIEGIDEKLSALRESGEDKELEELLTDRSRKYKGYVQEGMRYFILDGQTRLHNYKKYYGEFSQLKIKYPESTSDKFFVAHDGEREFFTLNDRTFDSLSKRQKMVFYGGLPVELKVISATDYTTPASAFKIVNSGVTVRLSLTAINGSFNGLRNQIEVVNLRDASDIRPELIDKNHDVYEKYFYSGQQTHLFGQISKGIHAFSYLELTYLFGDEMNDPIAEKLKGKVIFAENKDSGWTGVVEGPMANPISVLSPKALESWIDIRTGMGTAMFNLERDGNSFSYETSSKVNGVYFVGILKDMDYLKYDWTNLCQEYLLWNYQRREETRYVKVSAVHLQTGDIRYTQEDVGTTDYTDPKKKDKIERSEGYCYWGLNQYNTKNLQSRKNEIQSFINDNIEDWKKEGYLV